MATESVRVYDFKRKKLTTMPARELAPGMVQAQVEGIDGLVYVDASQATSSSVYRHPPFDEEKREVMALLQRVFHDVYPCTLEKWEDGFRKDTNPEKEIGLWLQMGYAFAHFTKGRQLDGEQRMDIFKVINGAMNVGKERVHLVVSPRTLSKNRVKEIAEFLFTKPADGAFEAFLADA